MGFLRSKDTTKILRGSRNTSLLSQGAIEGGFGLFISKQLQSLTLSGITEQEEDAQKCLKVLKILKGDNFSNNSPANSQSTDICLGQVTLPTIQHLKPLLCPLVVLPVPLTIPAVPLHGSARSSK